MMTSFVCPVCGSTEEPRVREGHIVICPTDGASLVMAEDGQTFRATVRDLDGLSPGARARLTRARSAIARPKKVG